MVLLIISESQRQAAVVITSWHNDTTPLGKEVITPLSSIDLVSCRMVKSRLRFLQILFRIIYAHSLLQQ